MNTGWNKRKAFKTNKVKHLHENRIRTEHTQTHKSNYEGLWYTGKSRRSGAWLATSFSNITRKGRSSSVLSCTKRAAAAFAMAAYSCVRTKCRATHWSHPKGLGKLLQKEADENKSLSCVCVLLSMHNHKGSKLPLWHVFACSIAWMIIQAAS
jgi:hypothetical protein